MGRGTQIITSAAVVAQPGNGKSAGRDGLGFEHLDRPEGADLGREHATQIVLERKIVGQLQSARFGQDQQNSAVQAGTPAEQGFVVLKP